MTDTIKDAVASPPNTQKLISDALNTAYIQGGVEALTNVLPALEQLQMIVAASMDSIKEYIEANKDNTVSAVAAANLAATAAPVESERV